MATGTRLRFNFIEGNLDGTISALDDEISSPAFEVLPVIDHAQDGGFAVLAIAGSEVAHIVAHEASSPTVTIERGQEGTAPQAHADGSTLRHGSTAEDFDEVASSALVFAIALGE